jgi:hypothetical protein
MVQSVQYISLHCHESKYIIIIITHAAYVDTNILELNQTISGKLDLLCFLDYVLLAGKLFRVIITQPQHSDLHERK